MTVPIEVQIIQLPPASGYDDTFVIAGQLGAGGIGSTQGIPITDILAPLGTMAYENSNAVSITGGTINSTSIGATTPSTGKFTSLTDNSLGTGVVHSSSAGLFSSSLIVTADITANNVTNATLAQMPANTIKANNTGSTANATDITTTQLSTMLGLGTMAFEDSTSVSITGGAINGTTIGSITPSTVISTQFTALSTTDPSRAIPVMTQAQINSISSPAEGDMVFNSDAVALYYYNGAAFVPVSSPFQFTAIANCNVAQTSNLTATYSNGASGVGATLTNSGVQAALVVDSVTVSVGNRVLVQNQTLPAQNGIYDVTDTGSAITNWVLTRSTDYDTGAQVTNGDVTTTTQGTNYAGILWLQTSSGTIVIGTSPIQWIQFSTAQQLTAGFGLQIVGNTISVIGSTFLQSANNLSDVANVATSRANLGLGTMAVQNASSIAVTGGTIDGTVIGGVTPAAGTFTALTDNSLGLGVVHSSAGGAFTSSLIVNADITAATITGAKLATNTVALTNISQVAANTILGNNTVGTANVTALTIAQVQTMINGTTGTLGSMAYEDSNAISVTGGTMSGVAISFGSVSSTQISGSQMNSTTIGAVTPSTGVFTSITESTFGADGVVHNNSSGVFSSSLIVAADITASTITGAKIATNTVGLSNIAQIGANTILGNNTGGTANVTALTVSQVQAMLGAGSSTPLTAGQIGFGSASNTLTSSGHLLWDDTNLVMQFANNTELNFSTSVNNRKIVLYGAPGGNNFQFYGIGVQSNAQQYVTLQSSADHVFLCGASSSAFSELARIKGTGGIQLPTTGGTAAALTYYEEATAISMTLTGPWGATTCTLAVKLSRVGNVVTMSWADSSPTSRVATGTSTITTSTGTAIPSRFIPAVSGGFYPMPVINFSGSNTGSWGSFFFSSGVLIITSAINGQFTNGNNAGVIGGAMSWLV